MLFGTPLLFRIAYFFTSFTPSLFMLAIKIHPHVDVNTKFPAFNKILYEIIKWSPIVVVVMSSLLSVKYIKKYLQSQCQNASEVPNLALNFNRQAKLFKNNNQGYVIQVQDGPKINTGFIAFATSVVAPSVVLGLVKENQLITSLIIVILFYLLLMFSNDTFPNIILPIFGVQLLTTKDGYNIFYFSKYSDRLSGIKKLHSLGNGGSLSRTYIMSNIEFSENEVIDKE